MKHGKLEIFTFLLLGMLLHAPDLAVAELFADLYLGAAYNRNLEIDFEVPSTGLSATEEDDVTSFVFGGRFGNWFKKNPAWGLALDASYFEPDVGDANIRLIPLSLLLMFRMRGPVMPHVAIGPALFFSDIDYNLSEFGISKTYSDRTLDLGLDARLGFSWKFSRSSAMLVEYRFTYVELGFEGEVQGEKVPLEPSLQTQYLIVGVSYHF